MISYNRNRLTSVVSRDIYGVVTQTVSYEYDVNDLRVSKNVDGSVEKYFLDGDNIAFVTDGAGKQTFHYLYGMEADQVLAQDSETGMVWSLADRLGSIDVLVNEQGIIVDQRTYDSFGNTLSQLDPTVKFRFGYTGRESDPETGLYYYRARYFDANVGRFISTDPIGFEAGDSNLYRYVNNSSTLATDPSGEFANILGGAVIGGFIGFGISTARQFAKINDGGSFDINEVLTATFFGAVGGAVVGANPLLAAPLALFGAAQGGISAVNEYSQGHNTTALFDAVTSVFSFGAYKSGGGGFGGKFAFAEGGVGSAVGVGASSYAGAGVQGLLLERSKII